MNHRACVVEVVEQVAEADVAIVAARVGERLAMAPDRVRKLIEGRTGPITRALRADKADAIAQTFEAAGVRVVIRPAEPEEIEDLNAAQAAAAAGSAVVPQASEPAPRPVPEPASAPGPEPAQHPDTEPAPYGEPEPQPEPELGTDPEPEPEPGLEPARDAGGAPALDVETEPAPALVLEPEPAPDGATEPSDVDDPAAPRLDDDPAAGFGDIDPEDELGDDVDDDVEFDAGDGLPEPDPSDVEPAAGGAVFDVDDMGDTRFTSTGEWVAGDAGVWSTSRAERAAGDGAAADPDAIEPDADPDPIDLRGRVVGRASRRPRAEVVPVDDVEPSDPAPAAPRPVPIAWRGLGPEPAGPARPVDARLPRRYDPDAPIDIPEDAPRQRRRTVMLVLLGIAIAGFLFSQWWVSRAGAAVDTMAGMHAFHDGDFDAARRYWGAQASAGDPAAQFMLGYMSEAGLGAPWSARAAASWYRAAADAGHAEAAWRLGRLYEAGLGVAPDDAEARRWFRHAADLGHAEASFAWGRSWMRELGVAWARDGVETWPAGVVDELSVAFERAASLGFHEAAPYAASLALARAAGLP